MSVLGRWRIVEMPDATDDYPDMREPAHFLFQANGSGDFAFGSLKGQICFHGGDEANFIARRETSSTAC